MLPSRITEAEIIDVLMGGADAELEARVREAVRTDPQAAALYSEWSRTLPGIAAAAAPSKELCDRISAGVMESLREGSARIGQSDDAELADWIEDEAATWSARRRRGFRVAGAAAAALLLAAAGGWMALSSRPTVQITTLSGDGVAWLGGETVGEPVALSTLVGETLRFPVIVEVKDGGVLQLAYSGGVELEAQADTRLRLIDALSVNQQTGTASYRIPDPDADRPFTVMIPHGSVVDLGTAFAINLNHPTWAEVSVQEGAVEAIPRRGESQRVSAGERGLMSATGVRVEPILPPAEENGERGGELIAVDLSPTRRTLSLASNLAQFIHPGTVGLSGGDSLNHLQKAPATTDPLGGTIRFKDGEDFVELNVLADRGRDDRWQLYVDINGNGDLTDDPVYTEGVDFLPGTLFPVGSTESGKAVWLSRPAPSSNANQVADAEVRLDYYNLNYLVADVDLPVGRGGETVRDKLILLDRDSDGDYGNEGGALALWTNEPDSTGRFHVHGIGFVGEPLVHRGWRWSLGESDTGGRIRLEGEKVPSGTGRIAVGSVMPPIEVTTVTGERIALQAPRGGYLLVYVWNTWHSAADSDLPVAMMDLYPKFAPRGLSMVGISTDYRKVDLLNFLEENEVPFPQVFHGPDLYQGLTARLGIEAVPTAILIDSRGAVVSVDHDANQLWSFLDRNLPARGAQE